MKQKNPRISGARRVARRPPPRRREPDQEETLDLLLEAFEAAEEGDFSVRVATRGLDGTVAEIAESFNRLLEKNERMTQELVRVGNAIGEQGRPMDRSAVRRLGGAWDTGVDAVCDGIEEVFTRKREILRIIQGATDGDLSSKMPLDYEGRPVRGESLNIATAVNGLVDRLRSVSMEVTRVAKEVGVEGKLGGQAEVKGAAGSWKDLTDSVNMLAGNLTSQVRSIALVTTAVATGDLSQKIKVDAKGEILELKNTINVMVDQLNAFAAEVTRVAKEVGTDGKLGGQAEVRGVSGIWKDLTENVNSLAWNLTAQVRNIALVTTSVANGDLSKKITVDARGEILQLKDTINVMVDQLRAFAAEVTRVAREVGTEGKLGGQAQVPGVAGTWKDLTDNVNLMASNLTDQVRGIVKVVTAVADGDLNQKFVLEAKGEIAALADTINDMTDTLRVFAEQVVTVAREVGIDGKLGGQAKVPGAAGTWRDLTDNVNMLAGNLTSQVRNIALVTTAVANGDLSQKITVDAKGEILELKDTINAMVEQLRTFAREVTRVAREVGTEGKLGGQAQVPGVAGTWQDLTDGVNLMGSNLTTQVRGIVNVVTAVANGDLTQKLVLEAKGEIAALADTINKMTDTLRVFADQVTTVAREVGIEGKLGGQAKVAGVSGTWKDLTDNVNLLAGNLTSQVRNIALVTTAVAKGDLSQKIKVDAKGEILELKDTINVMVDQLNAFAAEVTRVAREVGTEGKLGGQAKVAGVSGIWEDLTDNVNLMATNLTDQVRGIVKVVTAVANGNLGQKLALEAKGEIAALADTINGMTDTLMVFAEQVTTVAREVGIEGRLGGQARVPGAAGTWRDLTDNVNQLAGNLTTQVRAISEVATAVTKGDLTRTIAVEAQGEVLTLKDNINKMIANLRDTTLTNKEQDWLKTNLAKFSSMMQGQRSVAALARLIMSELTPLVSAQHGAFFVIEQEASRPELKLLSSYAYRQRKTVSNRFAFGEGLVGQAALERKAILVSNVPEDYIHITSGLGEAPPRNILVLPVVFEGDIKGVIELASIREFSGIHLTFLDQLMMSIGVVLNMIGASTRTEELLQELKGSNVELESRTSELEDKASLLEVKNREIAEASASLEEKAKQLALVSKYKSEFLANMSHELRTPLNSLLILAKMMAENEEGNLTPKQVEYARTIHSSGKDLLALIGQILDLSKIEAGKTAIERQPVSLGELRQYVDRSFRQVAQEKGLDFSVSLAPGVPRTITTDSQRLQQILKNLLSNAVKFTEAGKVALDVRVATRSERFKDPALSTAPAVLAFVVSDTGTGIAPEKRQLIFEAFQQADASTSRTYGGTGLGLTISRELSRLLGGEIHLESEVEVGSTFTLFLPCQPEDLGRRAVEAAPLVETELGESGATTWEAGGTGVGPRAGGGRRDVFVEGEPRAAEENGSLAGKKVLLVDDDVRNLFAVTSLLEREKMDVIPIRRGVDALELLRRSPDVDLILMDIMMPEMDGYEATREIRKVEGLGVLPIIALTAKAMPGDREKAFEAGCTDYVSKPIEIHVLLQAMRNALRTAPGIGAHDA